MADHHTAEGPAVTLRETVRAVATDAADLAGRLPSADGSDAGARQLARLSEELAEACNADRVLPGVPADMSGHDHQLLCALRTAHEAGEDVAEFTARGLAALAAELGSSAAVLANRPGSWEAACARQLLAGTLGPDDEGLDDPAEDQDVSR
jgi:hypothetical protein